MKILGKNYPNKFSSWVYTFNRSRGISTQTSNTTQQPAGLLCGPCGDNTQSNLKIAAAFSLTCMDFRLRDNITCNLNLLGYKNNHDEAVLAGSSLGYNGITGYESWVNTIDDHIKLAYDLHHIHTVIIVDHMYCGAYGLAYPELTLGGEEEYQLHIENLNAAEQTIKAKYSGETPENFLIPNLVVKKYIISIDGKCMVDIDTYTGAFPF